MRLARVTLIGFKSFAEKVELVFEPGVTAIVGPNGCGKSNLADAIRWALGEQSAKLLRCNRMEDLIFAGTSHRKPLGMVEVSLTFTDNAGDIPTEFQDVTVTRRLYRSGESEYFINHAPCRLRDIAELFLDTGLGGEPYALIEQGTICQVVDAKPAERRVLIEEAAGIMTYKVRRKAALAKLESAELNLLRITDVIHEVERQCNALKRQVAKATRYRSYQERVRELKGFVRYHEGRELRQQLHAAEAAEQLARQQADAAEAAVSAAEAAVESVSGRALVEEQARAAAQDRLHAVRHRLSRDEADLGHLREALEESARQQATRQGRLERLQERLGALQREMLEARQQERLLSQEIDGLERELEERTSALRALDGALAEGVSRLDAQRRRVLAEAASVSERRTHLGGLQERARLYARQRDLAIERCEACERQDRDLASLEADQQRLLDRVLEGVTRCRAEQEEVARRARQAESDQEVLRAQMETLREQANQLHSRLASLRELAERFEGYEDGQRYLLQQKAGGEARLAGIRAALAELIETPPRYERAIEALLGDAVQGLVVDDVGEAEQGIAVLRERGQGRATFLVRRENGPRSESAASIIRRELTCLDPALLPAGAIQGFAVDLIRCGHSDRGLIERLLADALVVDALGTALNLSGRLCAPFTIATLDGEIVSSTGVIAGGPGGTGGLLARRRETAEVEARVREQDDRLRAVEAEWEACSGRLAQLAETLDSLAERLRELEVDRFKAEKELSLTRAERRRIRQQIELLTFESKTHAEDLRVLGEEIERLEAELLEAEQRYRTLQAEAAELEVSNAARQQDRDRLVHDVAELRVRRTALDGKRDLLARSVRRIEEEVQALCEERGGLEAELAAEARRRTEMEETVIVLRERLGLLAEEERAGAQALTEHEEGCRALADQRETIERQLRELRQDLARAREQLSAASIRRAELRSALAHFDAAVADEGLGEIETLAAGLAAGGLLLDEARRELSEVSQRLADLGPVNLAAIGEYEELTERHRFLSSQAEDLRASVRSLRATIAELNTTIHRRFSDTIQIVNAHLDRLWKRLFAGGEAELRIVEAEPGDEEPGLDLFVRVPGKRASLNLLSGGEKALAALALLLAIFQTHPSPFCLLDEVDAPLDDTNVERFASLLRELAADSQFIVITHNKRTMEAADRLYGVTMEDHGLSKLLSLRMGCAT